MPGKVDIASDGSFFLVVDSANPAYVRKVKFSGAAFTDEAIIPLQNNPDGASLNIGLSKNNKKAYIFREISSVENSQVQIIDLADNSAKVLMSGENLKIGAVAFADPQGKRLFIGTDEETASMLFVIDTDLDKIETQSFNLLDSSTAIDVSPDFKKAIISYKGFFAQSLSLLDIATSTLKRFDTPPGLFFDIYDFLLKGKYNFSGNKTAISSFGGKHAVSLFDLQSEQLIVKILSNSIEGSSFSDISCDGKTVVTVSNVDTIPSKFRMYKLDTSNFTSPIVVATKTIDDGSIVVDVDISRDGNEVLVLVLKDGKRNVKVFDLRNFTELDEFTASGNETETTLEVEPFGRYALLPDSLTLFDPKSISVSTIVDFGLGPVIGDINPKSGTTDGGTSFLVDGFIDPFRFNLGSTMVCFRNLSFCNSSTNVTANGRVISGLTPAFPTETLEKIILSSEPLPGCMNCVNPTTSCQDIFQFIKDNIPPEITIHSPENDSFFNSKRIKVELNVTDNREVSRIFVNGKEVDLSSIPLTSRSSINISTNTVFANNGIQTIVVKAIDNAGNESEESVQIVIDTVTPIITIQSIVQNNQGGFQITAKVDGTGSPVAKININGSSIQFTPGGVTTVSFSVASIPFAVEAFDQAGNRTEVKMNNPSLNDTPPTIIPHLPNSGDVFSASIDNSPLLKELSFSVTDDIGIDSVFLKGAKVFPALGSIGTGNLSLKTNNAFQVVSSNYLENINLQPGDNLITIRALDTGGNQSTVDLVISFLPDGLDDVVFVGEGGNMCTPIILSPGEEDINSSILNIFGNSSCEGASEVTNLPPLDDGEKGVVLIPEEDTGKLVELPLSIPRGCSLAVILERKSVVELGEGDLDGVFSVVLTDTLGQNFICGIAYLKEKEEADEPPRFVTTIRVPINAAEGKDGTISILNKNTLLATAPINIPPLKDLRTGKSRKAKKIPIKNPIIKDPVKVILKKLNGPHIKLILRIKSTKEKDRRLAKKFAIVDGERQLVVGKNRFHTKVIFVPPDGIIQKRMKFTKGRRKFFVRSEIEKSKITSHPVRLANIVTPQCADIVGFESPGNMPLSKQKLKATTRPETLIFARFGVRRPERNNAESRVRYLDDTYVIRGCIQQ